MDLSGRHWIVAAVLALGLHAGLAYALLLQPEPSGAIGSGVGGIEISLGAAGAAAGSVAVDAEEVAEDMAEPEQRPDPPAEIAAETAETEPVSEPPVQETAVEPDPPMEEVAVAELSEPAPEPEPQPVVLEPLREQPIEAELAVLQPVQELEDVEPVPEVELEKAKAPVLPPKPRPHKPTLETAAVLPPKPAPASEPERVAEPEPAAVAESIRALDEIKTAAVRPSVAGANGISGTREAPDRGDGDSAASGGAPGVAADYVTLLQAWLEKHKTYPRRARTRRQEGVVLVYFMIDRAGRVLEHRIEESSGHRLLDREVAEMIQRAAPMPAMPDGMSKTKLALVVPVQFRLR